MREPINFRRRPLKELRRNLQGRVAYKGLEFGSRPAPGTPVAESVRLAPVEAMGRRHVAPRRKPRTPTMRTPIDFRGIMTNRLLETFPQDPFMVWIQWPVRPTPSWVVSYTVSSPSYQISATQISATINMARAGLALAQARWSLISKA